MQSFSPVTPSPDGEILACNGYSRARFARSSDGSILAVLDTGDPFRGLHSTLMEANRRRAERRAIHDFGR